ncbi:hypothetical protein M8C21_004494 [Ambrosia artemisiifolia]|uniref:Uncharacterized protein n=1 Tax=Ambrosia artemisiifolia TaxID=4212 RepID=A0AAD5CZD7_AMBAR|nr:hypothetical protein M8C21_004494 [Ambrosia artemisiifolia]
MDQKSWVCTVITQLSLCFALYCVISIGEPQTPSGLQRQPNEIYFISVVGGYRPLKQQTHLLKQIEKMIFAYDVGFVINISELGEDDPLLHHATQYFNSLRAPWYTTVSQQAEGPDYFFKQFNISSGRTLAVISLNTKKLQDSSSDIEELQFKQLSRTLELSNSNWHIATVVHPLFCNQSLEQTRAKGNDYLHHMLLKHGVDAYLSGQSCDNRTGGPYLAAISQGSYPPK